MQYTKKEAFAIAQKIAKGIELTEAEHKFVMAQVENMLKNEVVY